MKKIKIFFQWLSNLLTSRSLFEANSRGSFSRQILLFAAVLFLCAFFVLGVVEFKDGIAHDNDYAIYDDVYVGYQVPEMCTKINIPAGGSINLTCAQYTSVFGDESWSEPYMQQDTMSKNDDFRIFLMPPKHASALLLRK